jgi:hypothetical protein
MTTPERTLQQRRDALQHANDIRKQRAALKRDLKAGTRSIFPLLADPPDWLETAKVYDMLLALPKFGRVKVNKALFVTRISASKTVGGLSARQRAELISYIGPYTPRPVRGDNLAALPMTNFQARALGVVCATGPLAPLTLAQQMTTDVIQARNTIVALKRRGLLDEEGVPTSSGRSTPRW